MLTERSVRNALTTVMDPELGRSIVEMGMVRQIQVQDRQVTLALALTTAGCPFQDQIVADVQRVVQSLDEVGGVAVTVTVMSQEERARCTPADREPGHAAHLNDIRHVIAVISGKGGVGKSSVAALLAVALRRQGQRVGLLDADITGPSIPKMLFPGPVEVTSTPVALLPAESRTGIKAMSINLLLERQDQAVIWRGPLVGRAIQEFYGDVLWGALDYLIVDLPPGTSDASLTVMQSLPLSGVILVTSPQSLAGLVVRKAAQMALQLRIPLLGLIENMSHFVCPHCSQESPIFGPSYAEEMAWALGTVLLGRLPIDPELVRLSDEGRIEEYQSAQFQGIVDQIVEAALAPQPPRFPVG